MRDFQTSTMARDAFGSELKKYAIVTMISSIVTLIAGGVLQYFWFDYDYIMRNNWLRISSKGYTSEELPLIKFCQSSAHAKIVPALSLIAIAALVVFMVFDIRRDVWKEEYDHDCTKSVLFRAKSAAVAVCSLVMTGLLALAAFLGEGCFTYVDKLYRLDQRYFVPTNSDYKYWEVWIKHPSIQVSRYVYGFLLLMLFFFCLHLFVSLGKLLSEHTSQVISLVSSIIMMVLVGGVVVATKASLPILVVMIAVAFGADFLFQSYSRETSKRFA